MLIFYCSPPQPLAGQINCYSYFKTLSKDSFQGAFPHLSGFLPPKVLLLTDYITYHITGCLWSYLATGLGAPSGHVTALGVLVTPFYPLWVLWHLAQWLMCSGGSVHICEMSKIAKEAKLTFEPHSSLQGSPLHPVFSPFPQPLALHTLMLYAVKICQDLPLLLQPRLQTFPSVAYQTLSVLRLNPLH